MVSQPWQKLDRSEGLRYFARHLGANEIVERGPDEINPEKELSSFGAMRGLSIVPVIVIGLAAMFAIAMFNASPEAGGVGGYVVALLAVPAAIAVTGWMRRADRLKVTLTDRRVCGVTRMNSRWVRFSVPHGDIDSVKFKFFRPKIILGVRGHDKELEIPMIRDFVALNAFLSEVAGLPRSQ